MIADPDLYRDLVAQGRILGFAREYGAEITQRIHDIVMSDTAALDRIPSAERVKRLATIRSRVEQLVLGKLLNFRRSGVSPATLTSEPAQGELLLFAPE